MTIHFGEREQISMKRMLRILFLSVAMILVYALSACSFAEQEIYTIQKLNSMKVDMSAYKGMSSTNHRFLRMPPEELIKLIEEKGSAVFYIGYSSCPNCQEAVKLINAVAEEYGIVVYYIDCYDENDPLSPYVEEYEEVLYSILPEKDGERSIQVPLVFAVRKGTLSESYCGLISSYDGSEESDQKMIGIYKDIMKNFEMKE